MATLSSTLDGTDELACMMSPRLRPGAPQPHRVLSFLMADVIHDFDGSGDVGGRGIGVRHDLAEGVVSPCPGRAVFFDGV